MKNKLGIMYFNSTYNFLLVILILFDSQNIDSTTIWPSRKNVVEIGMGIGDQLKIRSMIEQYVISINIQSPSVIIFIFFYGRFSSKNMSFLTLLVGN